MRRSLEMPLRISEPLSTTVGQTTLAPVRAESFSISLVTSSYAGSARASLPVGAAPGMGSRYGLARGSSSAAVGIGRRARKLGAGRVGAQLHPGSGREDLEQRLQRRLRRVEGGLLGGAQRLERGGDGAGVGRLQGPQLGAGGGRVGEEADDGRRRRAQRQQQAVAQRERRGRRRPPLQ